MKMKKINRKKFISKSILLSGGLMTACRYNLIKYINKDFDMIIRNGEIFDGTDSWSYKADIGIIDGVIAAIGNLKNVYSSLDYDAKNMAVAPGFIDIHSHSDYSLLHNGLAHSKILQGVTTEIIGQDGRSVAPRLDTNYNNVSGFQSYYKKLLRQGISLNVRSMVGAATLRSCVMGNNKRKPAEAEISRMKKLYSQSESQGAIGISSGLEYLPGAYAEIAELSALCEASQLYSTHMRNEDDNVIYALEEAILIAKNSRARLNISHIKAQGKQNWDKLDPMLDLLDDARDELDFVSCDRYPYLAYHTSLANLFPVKYRRGNSAKLSWLLGDKGHRKSMKNYVMNKVNSLGSFDGILLNHITANSYKKFTGWRLSKIARSLDKDPYDLLCKIMVQSGGAGSMVGFGMEEDNLDRLMKYKYCAIASDGAALQAGKAPHAHPRNFGSFAEVLGKFVRDRNVISLEKAVYKMSHLPAQIMKIPNRGKIEEGYFADLVVFDPNQIKSNATYLKPDRYATGIKHVFVNGKAVVIDGEHTGERPGIIV